MPPSRHAPTILIPSVRVLVTIPMVSRGSLFV